MGPHPTPWFPASADRMHYSADRMHYSADEWGKVAQWLPSTVNFTSVEQLQRLVAVYRSQYLHMCVSSPLLLVIQELTWLASRSRRWIIVVTPEEQANATKVKLPGVSDPMLSRDCQKLISWTDRLAHAGASRGPTRQGSLPGSSLIPPPLSIPVLLAHRFRLVDVTIH